MVRILKTIWVSVGVIFLIWNWTTFQARDLPPGTLESNSSVTVSQTDDVITFVAASPKNRLEAIFFQGGLVDPEAYASLCYRLAEGGFTSHIVKMNWRLPQYDYQKTLSLFPLESGTYVVGGHSQGGKMAAQIVYENPDLFKGLFLLGTSHPRDYDLSGLSIPVLKVYAEKDGRASVEKVMSTKHNLPAGSEFVEVKGGNHSQFGYMGKLFMDHSADILLEEQQDQTVQSLLRFLKGMI